MTDIVLVDPSVEELDFKNKSICECVEIAARTCYKSEAKMTEGSAEPFTKRICDRGHTAMLEHATVYLLLNQSEQAETVNEMILLSKYSVVNYDKGLAYVTTNFRVIFNEFGNFEDALTYVRENAVKPTKHHTLRRSFRFICDRGVSHELVRHRVMSFAQESSRYCNYANKGYQFIKPSWWDDSTKSAALSGQLSLEQSIFLQHCQQSADDYQKLIELGQTPQQARAVLPNAVKTEIVITATEPEWEAWLGLRNSKAAHPDMQIVAKQLEKLLHSKA